MVSESARHPSNFNNGEIERLLKKLIEMVVCQVTKCLPPFRCALGGNFIAMKYFSKVFAVIFPVSLS